MNICSYYHNNSSGQIVSQIVLVIAPATHTGYYSCMMSISLIAFGSVAVVSLISLIGIFTISFNERFLKKCVFILVSLAVGALFGDAIIHLLPEVYESGLNPIIISLFVLSGIVAFFILEKFLHWHHHSGEIEDHRNEVLIEEKDGKKINPLGYLILTSDSIHNLIDGIIIGASYFISIEVGLATTMAVILHEIPQEIADFGVLIHAGFTKIRALLLNFLTALFALVGVSIAFTIPAAAEHVVVYIIAFAAGNFLYIAGSDLVPELQKTKSLKHSFFQLLAMLVGIGLMFALLFLE